MPNYVGPLEVNLRTKEPFIRLRKHTNIIITPPRESDIPCILSPMNDEHHAQTWIKKIKPGCDSGFQQLIEALRVGKRPILTHSPVRFLREVQKDGSDIFLGDVGLFRCPAILLENPKHNNATNLTLPEGHPNIIWTIGDFLIPSHHREGIMTDAVDTLIEEIGKPLLKVRHTIAMAYIENEGSRKVFMRNAFNPVRRITDYAEVKGVMHDLVVFERCDNIES